MAPLVASVEVGPEPPAGEGRVRRSFTSPDQLVTSPSKDIKVLADVLIHAVKEFRDVEALGWRDTVDIIKEDKEVKKTVGGKEVTEKKTWSYFHLSAYKWWTYKQFADVVADAGSALVKVGASKDTIFNIYSATSPRWQVMANACASQSITFATAYDSLGEEGLRHSINEPSCYGIFTNASLLGTLSSVVASTPSLKVIVYDGPTSDIPKGALDTLRSVREGAPAIEIYTFDEFLKLGKENPAEPNHPQPEDIATLMYTSGSTGAPKGVQITNGNIVACLGAVQTLIPHVVKKGETYIAYLPLAHIMEFAVELCFMFVGARMGYGNVKTLTDASVRNCVGDIRELQPTIMVGVPAVWETIRKGIVSKVKAAGALKSKVFDLAVGAKRLGGRGSILGNVADTVVFNAVKQGTGGKLKYALSGGAPISKDTQEFLTIALVMIIQGYGMTESTAMCCLLPPEFHTYQTVGVPVPSNEIKLVDVVDAGYKSTNKPFPQGEIWIRGPSVTKGYYKREDLTAEAWTEDGWFKTGDVGQWNANGTLSVIDRKKNLVKLAGGEYIALERLESTYRSCEYVAAIMVHADSNANKPMAVIFPHEANLKKLASELSISGDLSTLAQSSQIRDAVLKSLNAVGKKAGFKALEMLQTVVITDEEWTPQNGLMTAASKLNRPVISKKFKAQIDADYP